MLGVITSKYDNPEPFYNWEPLDLDMVEALTNIKLEYKEWKVYFTNFHIFVDKRHTQECMDKHLHSGYISCNCVLGDVLVATWKAGTQGISGVARGRELFVNIPHENVPDTTVLTDSTKRANYVKELLYRGFEQLITLLKVYEVTRLVLDFGPPMRLYTEDTYKHRQYIRDIDGNELWEILHGVQQKDVREVSTQIGNTTGELGA